MASGPVPGGRYSPTSLISATAARRNTAARCSPEGTTSPKCSRTFSAASLTAEPREAVPNELVEAGAAGNAECPITTSTRRASRPSSSAAICARAV